MPPDQRSDDLQWPDVNLPYPSETREAAEDRLLAAWRRMSEADDLPESTWLRKNHIRRARLDMACAATFVCRHILIARGKTADEGGPDAG